MPAFITNEARAIKAVVEALPEKTRHVFTLRKVYGYDQASIANHLAIPESEVERHLGIAAKAIANALSPMPADLAVEHAICQKSTPEI